ncbi:hypothetical protein RQP46_001547 [Phenoliferia psychrophenolica]
MHTAELKRQFGLAPDPNAHDVQRATPTFPSLVRTVTPGDSDQPGFPIFHRHIANPVALGSLSFGATLFIFGLCLVHARSMKTTLIFYTIGLPFGGIGGILAGLWFFPAGQTYGLTSFGILGGTLFSFCIADLPWAGVQGSYLAAAPSLLAGVVEIKNALGILIFVAFILLAMLGIASFKTSMPLLNAVIMINVGLILYGLSLFQNKDSLAMGAGGVFLFVGCLLYYAAASVLLKEEGVNFLPVFPLPHVVS